MNVTVERHGHWTRLRLTPEKATTGFLEFATLQSLTEALQEEASRPDGRCLILDVTHCAGAAFVEVNQIAPALLLSQVQKFINLLQSLHDFPSPVIFHGRGHLRGGTLGLLSACDIVLAEETSTFSLPEATQGLAPILISPWLRRRIGAAQFRHLALSGVVLDALSALRIGLVDGLSAETNFPVEYTRILRSSPVSWAKSKQLSRFTPPVNLAQDFMEYLYDPTCQQDLTLIMNGQSPDWRRKKEHGSH